MPDSAVIGYVTSGWVRAEFCAWLARSGRDFLAEQSGPNISEARNRVVQRFLAGRTAPWLFMADTDMVFAEDIIGRLITTADPAERPIVGALYYGLDGTGISQPHLYELITTSGQPGFICYRHGPGDDECLRVAATGAGALLLHRAALEKIAASTGDTAAPWFRESVRGDALFGEDLTFCLRAKDAGIPIYVHTGIRAGHMKTTMLGEVA